MFLKSQFDCRPFDRISNMLQIDRRYIPSNTFGHIYLPVKIFSLGLMKKIETMVSDSKSSNRRPFKLKALT